MWPTWELHTIEIYIHIQKPIANFTQVSLIEKIKVLLWSAVKVLSDGLIISVLWWEGHTCNMQWCHHVHSKNHSLKANISTSDSAWGKMSLLYWKFLQKMQIVYMYVCMWYPIVHQEWCLCTIGGVHVSYTISVAPIAISAIGIGPKK